VQPGGQALCADRARYGAQQTELLRALWRGEGFPAGFDDEDAGAASRSLIRKRARAVASSWPALTQSLGKDFMAAFERFARTTPPGGRGEGFSDGLAFARSLDRDALSDDARSELLLARGSIHGHRGTGSDRERRAGLRCGTIESMSDLLLAEELLLLALDPERGTTSSRVAVDPALAGALLLDLIAAGSLVETSATLAVDPDAVTASHSLLTEALTAISAAGEPKKPKHWVDKLPKQLKPIKGRVAGSLVSRGVLVEEDHKTLGLISSPRYPQADRGPAHELSARLQPTLLRGVEPEPRTARLVVLIRAVGLVPDVVPKDQRKAAEARAKTIAESNAVGDAVRRAVQEIHAAVAVAATVAATSSS